jgi:hypothetical protein
MKRGMLVAIAGLLLATGCVPSLHPLYTPDDLVFESSLLGTWSEPGKPGAWQFERKDEKSYWMTISGKDDNPPVKLVAHLTRLGDARYLDLCPDESNYPKSITLRIHTIPAHTFLRVHKISPTLQFSAMNPKELDRLLEKTPDAVKHEVVDNRAILTASPKALQEFLKQYADTPELFGGPTNLTRVADAPAEKAKNTP